MTCAFSSARRFPLAPTHRRPRSRRLAPSIRSGDPAVLVLTPYPSSKPFRFHTYENQGEGVGSPCPRNPLSLSSSLFAKSGNSSPYFSMASALFAKNTRVYPLFHPSVSATQSFLCFSGFRRLSGITFIPAGAGPTFRARRRASVPASSSFFFLRMMLSLVSPFTFCPQNATILVP